MTKQEILDKFNDIDFVYNDSSKYETLSRMLDELLKEQEEQKQRWLQTIADTQLAISPTGYESEDELAKRGWEWNGLQMAWEIITGDERSEHPRLVRCKDCKYWKDHCCYNRIIPYPQTDESWFCADGEREQNEKS